MAYTMDTTLGDLLKDPQVKPVMEQYLPGISTHPMVAMAAGMSLNAILNFPQAQQLGLTREKAEALLVEINRVAGG